MSGTAWIQTATGKRFYYDDLVPEQFDVYDMACGISRLCRYGGQLKDIPELEDVIYSVAQHSVYVYRRLCRAHVREDARPWGLLHDALEGYFVDMPSPLKGLDQCYQNLEHNAEIAFIRGHGIPFNSSIRTTVKWSDMQVLWAESTEMCATPHELWDKSNTPDMTLRELDPDFYFWSPKKARAEFLTAYEEIKPLLIGKQNANSPELALC